MPVEIVSSRSSTERLHLSGLADHLTGVGLGPDPKLVSGQLSRDMFVVGSGRLRFLARLAPQTTLEVRQPMAIDARRTSDRRFSSIPDFPYQPRYLEDLVGLEGLRMAVIDEGPGDAEHTYLCLHGQPTWSFLYRKMIPVFLEAGGRVVAPDFIGFGRSDKPVRDADYSFDFHRNSLIELVRKLDLQRVTLVVQDWGGVLGLTLPVERDIQPRITRLLAMNTGLAVGVPVSEGFEAWRAYCAATDDLAVGRLLKRSEPSLSDREAAAYDAPFPDKTYKAGVRAFPELVMTRPEMAGVPVSRAAARFWQEQWRGPTFMAVGVKDPVLGPPVMERLAALIHGCPEPLMLEQAGHFVQEHGDVVAAAALAHYRGFSAEG